MGASRRKVLQLDDLKTEVVPLSSLRPYAQNPRNGDTDLIANSIKDHGLYRPIVVSSDNVVLCGNHTYHAMLQIGRKQVLATKLPIAADSPQAAEIVLMDNRSSDMAKYDDGLLAKLLQQVQEDQGSLVATGFNDSYLENLLAKINEPGPEGFKEVGEDLDTQYKCPQCGYAWSGKPK